MKTIETKSAPAAIGPYSQAILANGFLYTSGQIPLNPETGAIEGQTIEAHAEQAIKNLGEILKAAGSDFSKVVKTTCFLAHISDFTFFIWALRQLRCRRAFRTSAIASYFASQSTPAAVLQSLTL